MNPRPTYGLVGRGRVATHMARYLELEARPCISWHRESASAPEDALASSEIILLAIGDDAVAPFVDRHPGLAERPLVHFSGSRVVEGVNGCHPLMTFGPELYDLETYRSMAFITERGAAGFETLFPGFTNPSWDIDPSLKPLYHALCVLGGNLSTLLWSKVAADFESRLGLPAEALRPYLEQSLNNAARYGEGALTGPLQRRDLGTVRKNLDALEGDPYAEVYRAFLTISHLEEVTA
jgi:predicted short-subunit dehydrogenase-like oxidoreductase (DUF2520 family)